MVRIAPSSPPPHPCSQLPGSPEFPPPIPLTMSTATLPKCWQCRELTLGWLERSWQPSELQPPGPPGASWLHQAATGSAPSAQCRSEMATGSVRLPTPQPPAGEREVHTGRTRPWGGSPYRIKQQQDHSSRGPIKPLGGRACAGLLEVVRFQFGPCLPGCQPHRGDPRMNQNKALGGGPF